MSLYRTIIPKYTFIPYDFPTSRDGKYHCLLDDGQILRSRSEQLGLSVYQVAEMAGIQFSQYQRLESGERFFSGCSMKIGLSVCAVLLLDPFEFFDVNVKQPKPDIMMLILSILVDTFISKISLTMQPGPKIDSISGA